MKYILCLLCFISSILLGCKNDEDVIIEDILFSKIASYLTIKSIKIQYMDGSVLILNRSILDKIELSDELNELNNNLN
jgi:hypothetical protein